MAPGCEPAAVRTMMDALQPICLGQSLAGAGGGGFLFILTCDADQGEKVQQILNSTQVRHNGFNSLYYFIGLWLVNDNC